MRTITTLAGLVALASVSAPHRRANWCAKDAGGVDTASTGGIVGAIGIGVAASRTGEGAFLPPG